MGGVKTKLNKVISLAVSALSSSVLGCKVMLPRNSNEGEVEVEKEKKEASRDGRLDTFFQNVPSRDNKQARIC